MDNRFLQYRQLNQDNPLTAENILLWLSGIGALVAGTVTIAAGGAAAAAAGGLVEVVQAGGGVALITTFMQFARRFF